jgi:transposase
MEALITRRDESYGSAAVRMALDTRRDPPASRGAIRRIIEQLGVHPEAMCNWVRTAEIDGGLRPGTSTSDAKRIADLEVGNRELRRASSILKSAS